MAEKFDEFAIRLHPMDDVAVLKRTVKAGTELLNGGAPVVTAKTIPAGHKVALTPIRDGAAVRRYGQIIGFAQGDIAPGEHVHTHNLVCKDFTRDYTVGGNVKPIEPARDARHFQGYARPGGKIGTRNYIAIISTVNCSASVSRYIKEKFLVEDLRRDFPNVDGVIALTHKVGCGIPVGGELEAARTRHGRHGASSEHFRLRDDWPRLRDEPGRFAAAELRSREREARRERADVHDHSRHRRRAQKC